MAHSASGALLYVFMDARHLRELLEAGRTLGLNYLNLVVWAKTNAGMGSLYRSQHELIAIFKAGRGRHVNNVELGRHGRNRTNVWTYPGVNTFRKGRLEDLAAHPTVKPMALVADAILDVTNRGDVVLDPFAGSGTTILAAERTGRKAHAIEIDPLYVDVAIRRWQERTGQSATLDATGQTFDEVAAARAGEGEARGRPRPLSPRAGSSRRIPGAQAVTAGGTNATAKPGSRP